MQAQLALLAVGAAMLVGVLTRGFAVESPPPPACPAGAKLGYDHFGQAFVDPSCTGCHARAQASPPPLPAAPAPRARSALLPPADRRRLRAWLVVDAP